MKMKGLGRGLDALLAGDESKKEIQRSLPVTALQPGKYQPRTQMDKESLEELAASIRANAGLSGNEMSMESLWAMSTKTSISCLPGSSSIRNGKASLP